jgi:hypothetical protein
MLIEIYVLTSIHDMLHINGNKKYEKKVVENNETYLS